MISIDRIKDKFDLRAEIPSCVAISPEAPLSPKSLFGGRWELYPMNQRLCHLPDVFYLFSYAEDALKCFACWWHPFSPPELYICTFFLCVCLKNILSYLRVRQPRVLSIRARFSFESSAAIFSCKK